MKLEKNAINKWWVLTGISLASFLGCIDFTIVNTALPAIQTTLHASMSQLQWVINIFLLALCSLMVISGRLADIHGRRLIMYIGMLGFGLTSLGAGLSTSINVLLLFRLGQGIFTAILYPAPGAIISNAFPENERGKAMGALFGVNGIGLAIGPVVGGVIVSALNWHWVFLVNVPLIILSFIICAAHVKESRSTEHGTKIDWWGALFLMLGVLSLTIAVVKGDAWGWATAQTLGCFGAALMSFILLFFIEKNNASPIIKFGLFSNRQFTSSIVATFALGFFYVLAFFLMPLFLHHINGLNAYQLGLMLLPTTAVMAALSPIIGRATDKVGSKSLLVFGLIFFILSAGLQAHFTMHSSLIFLGLAFAAMGVGWAALLGPSTVAALSSVPESVGGVAMGSSWTLHNVGGIVGLAVGTVVYHYYAAKTLAKSLDVSAHTAWIKAAVANPDHAAQLIAQHTGLPADKTMLVLKNFFIQGYHGAMLLLMASSTLAALFVLFVFPPNKTKKEKVDTNNITG
jgi:EmrB/QacA subfamily drug resistance transporter